LEVIMSESTHTVLRVVHLPCDKKGNPLPTACTHLAVYDTERKCIVGFRRMTRRALEQAEGGQAVLNQRARRGRLRAFLAALELGGRVPRL
jgi:hypothetical protein